MKARYRFTHRSVDEQGRERLWWEATRPVDSRTEVLCAGADWFWNRHSAGSEEP